MTQDHLLLQQYNSQAQGDSRRALDELVRRHLDLVYSSALRQVRDSHLAEDVTQAVFLILAQKARKIRDGVAVAGWLLAVTRTTAVDAMKRRNLDRRHEETLAKPEQAPAEAAPWEEIAPVLDGVLNRLPQRDRDAIVLRVLENQSLAQVGAELGISQDAAKMRIARALERLRKLLQRHGITTSAAALTATLIAHAVHAAPAHLLTATLTGTPSSSVVAIAKSFLRALAWNHLKVAAMVVLTLFLSTMLGAIVSTRAWGSPQHSASSKVLLPPSAESLLAAATLAKPVTDLPVFAPADMMEEPIGTLAGTRIVIAGPSPQLTVTSLASSLAADAMGNVYAVGMLPDRSGTPGRALGIVREKLSGQNEWTTILNLPTDIPCVAVAAPGDLYVGTTPWGILKRPAGQPDFLRTAIDKLAVGGTGRITALATDTAGDVYACGIINNRWVVRKQTMGSNDFSPVDDFIADPVGPATMAQSIDDSSKPPGPKSSITPFGMTVVNKGPAAGIYVVGGAHEFAGNDSSGTPVFGEHWLVRKSSDGGATWSTVDDNQGWAMNACADAAGNVYVVGCTLSTGRAHWVTRKSATGAENSWSVIDDFLAPSTNVFAQPEAAGTDLLGNLYVVGNAIDHASTTSYHAIIRSNVGGTWKTVEDYQPRAGRAGFTGFVADSNGHLYASGWIQGDISGWMIRSTLPALSSATVEKNPSSNRAGTLP